VLQSKKTKELYKGFAINLKQRIIEHNKGYVTATNKDRPWKLVYCEVYINKLDAMRREQYLKTGWGRNYLKKALKETLKI
jgi:putative endonuclease